MSADVTDADFADLHRSEIFENRQDAKNASCIIIVGWTNMKTYFEFKSDKFPPCDGEDEQINPGLWGKRSAEYLVQKLKAHGLETEEMNPEDWGWCIPIKNDDFSLWIGCGHQYGEDDQFLCFVQPDKPVIRKWFKKIDTTEQVSRIVEALENILTSDPEIREFRSWDEST